MCVYVCLPFRRLSIEDNSAQHAGHAAMRAVAGKAGGSSGETHFRVEIVSDAFEGKTLVQRHRAVNQVGVWHKHSHVPNHYVTHHGVAWTSQLASRPACACVCMCVCQWPVVCC